MQADYHPIESDCPSDPFSEKTLEAMNTETSERLAVIKLALDKAFLAGVSFGLKQAAQIQ